MNIQEPYKLSDIDLNNIVFKKIKLFGNKKIIFLKYRDSKLNNFVIQLSKINNNNVNNQNEIEFIIDNPHYIQFFETLDNFIIQQSRQNHIWFNHLIDHKLSMNYQRVLRDNNSIKLRLSNNEELTTKLLINNEIATNFDEVISNNSTTKIILEIYAVWVKNNSFGLLLRPVNILMQIKEKLVYNYKFLDDSDNDSINSHLSESHFQSEQNSKNYKDDEEDYEEYDEEHCEEDDEDDDEEHCEGENDKEGENKNDANLDKSTSNYNLVNNSQLFIKTNGIFNNNSSFSTTDELENDLNKLILG